MVNILVILFVILFCLCRHVICFVTLKFSLENVSLSLRNLSSSFSIYMDACLFQLTVSQFLGDQDCQNFQKYF